MNVDYQLLWHCAANLPYPQFYRAWHGLTDTSPLIQTLNLAQLPQLLQTQLTETNLHQTLQLLCIDGNKFDNRDNPAPDIYLQLVKKHHCPKSTEGTPRTLTELKIYWQLLDWEKHPILIFYEETKPQGFSPTFQGFSHSFRRYNLRYHRLTPSHYSHFFTSRRLPDSNYYELVATHYFRGMKPSSIQKFEIKYRKTLTVTNNDSSQLPTFPEL